MPKINIDELCQPITITVGGKEYVVEDISVELSDRMAKIKDNEDGTGEMAKVLAEILGADLKDINKLGLRKRVAIAQSLTQVMNEEMTAKNSPEAAVAP